MKTTIHLPITVCKVVEATIILTKEEHRQLDEMSNEEREAYVQQSYWQRRYALEKSKRTRTDTNLSAHTAASEQSQTTKQTELKKEVSE